LSLGFCGSRVFVFATPSPGLSRPMHGSYGDDARCASHENAPAITFPVKCL
jgi:hypothetical protein